MRYPYHNKNVKRKIQLPKLNDGVRGQDSGYISGGDKGGNKLGEKEGLPWLGYVLFVGLMVTIKVYHSHGNDKGDNSWNAMLLVYHSVYYILINFI